MLEVFSMVGLTIASLGLVAAIVFGVITLYRTGKEGRKTRDDIQGEIVTSSKAIQEDIATVSDRIQQAIRTDGQETRETIQLDGKETRETIHFDGKETRETIHFDGKETREAIRLDGKETKENPSRQHGSNQPLGAAKPVGHALIYGAGQAGQLLASRIMSKCTYHDTNFKGLKVVGFLDDDSNKWHEPIRITPEGLRETSIFHVFGGSTQLEGILQQQKIDVVLIAISEVAPINLKHVLDVCERTGKAWYRLEFTFTHKP